MVAGIWKVGASVETGTMLISQGVIFFFFSSLVALSCYRLLLDSSPTRAVFIHE